MKLPEDDLEQHLRSSEERVMKIRRLGKPELLTLIFLGSKLRSSGIFGTQCLNSKINISSSTSALIQLLCCRVPQNNRLRPLC